MLIELLCPSIETAINRVIKLDPEAKRRLLKLDRKAIKLEFSDLQQQLYFIVDQDYILVKSKTEQPISAELIGNSFSFFNLALTEQGQDSLFKGQVRFTGEINSAQQFQRFFEQLDIDWEEHLSHYTGDIAAHQLIKTGQQLQHWTNQSLATIKQNVSEYLLFESRSTPAAIEFENFYDEINELRSDIERMSLRIQRLQSQLNQQKQQESS